MVVITNCDNMFWGVTIDAGKKYSQVVKQAFHVSMAALESQAKKHSENVQVMLQHESSEYLLCTLHSNLLQQPLDLNFATGEQVAFSLNGAGVVHLTGYLIPDEEPDFDENSFSESEEEDVPYLVEAGKKGDKRKIAVPVKVSKKIKLSDSVDDDDDDDEEELDEDEDSEEEEEGFSDDFEDEFEDEELDDDEEDVDTSLKNKGQNKTPAKSSKSNTPVTHTNQKTPVPDVGSPKKPEKSQRQAGETPKSQNGTETPKNNSTPMNEESSKKKKKKKKKKNKEGDMSQNDSSASTPGTTPKSEQTSKTEQTPKKRVVAGGTLVEDLKIGHGPEARPGKMVSVYYVGTLAKSNKRFDSCTDGKPFRFRLNQGEVIKGWDNGVLGMKVGGKRRITVPANQGYGNVKQGPIPPNSTLVFEVELKAVS